VSEENLIVEGPPSPPPVEYWYNPDPRRNYEMTGEDRKGPPRLHVYLVCDYAGCTTRFYLHEDYRLRDLGTLASRSGWHVGLGADVRCPDHLHGEPLKIMPATLDPNETATEEQLSEVLERLEREGESE